MTRYLVPGQDLSILPSTGCGLHSSETVWISWLGDGGYMGL